MQDDQLDHSPHSPSSTPPSSALCTCTREHVTIKQTMKMESGVRETSWLPGTWSRGLSSPCMLSVLSETCSVSHAIRSMYYPPTNVRESANFSAASSIRRLHYPTPPHQTSAPTFSKHNSSSGGTSRGMYVCCYISPHCLLLQLSQLPVVVIASWEQATSFPLSPRALRHKKFFFFTHSLSQRTFPLSHTM